MGRDHKDKTRAQQRAAGTNNTALFDIVRNEKRRSEPRSTCVASCFETPLRSLLVLARIAMVGAFREEWPDPSGRLGRAADRRIARSRATRAVAEQDRDRLFIGPGWLKEPRVRITRKGRRR